MPYYSFQVKPLIWVEAQIERHSRSRIEFVIKARSQFKERRYVKWFLHHDSTWFYTVSEWSTYCAPLSFSTATNVEIQIPVPPDSTNPNVRTSMGSASYAPEHDALVWKIKSFPGGKVVFGSSAVVVVALMLSFGCQVAFGSHVICIGLFVVFTYLIFRNTCWEQSLVFLV